MIEPNNAISLVQKRFFPNNRQGHVSRNERIRGKSNRYPDSLRWVNSWNPQPIVGVTGEPKDCVFLLIHSKNNKFHKNLQSFWITLSQQLENHRWHIEMELVAQSKGPSCSCVHLTPETKTGLCLGPYWAARVCARATKLPGWPGFGSSIATWRWQWQ